MTSPDGGDPLGDLNRFWNVLILVARAELPARLRSKVGESDLVQQTLLEAHQNRDRIRDAGAGALAAWLRTTLKRKILDAVRDFGREKRDVGREVSLERAVEASSACLERGWAAGPGPGEEADRFERLRLLAESLAELPEDQRRVMEMRHCRGLKLKDIALQTGRTTGAVAGLLHRGLDRLRLRFQEGQA